METEQQNPSDQQINDPLVGWTKDDKFDLLQALKAFGSHDIEKILTLMPTKTSEQIKFAIDHYKNKALKVPTSNDVKIKERSNINNVPQIPLASWAKFLTDSLSFKELQTETATALRLIAELEDIPTALCTDNIDFKKIYLLMANAMEGKSLPYDRLIATVLDKCIVETALTSKAFIRNSAYKHVVDSINMSDKEINVFPRPTENNELATLRHLASQRTYNPLNISENFLKPSIHK